MKKYRKWSLPSDGFEGDASEYFKLLPDTLIMLKDGMPDGEGHRLVGFVQLVHPSLGSSNATRIIDLCQNQLEWLAARWAEICAGGTTYFGDIKDCSSLLLDPGNNRYWWIIDTSGTILWFDARQASK